MKIKAVGLLSGGLDSTLALKMIINQNIEVYALNFTSPFCTCNGRKDKGICSEAAKVAEEFSIPIKIIHKGIEYLEIVKNPKHGYGRAMNPCIDCRIYSFIKAKEYMAEIGADFIITGEVVGQRPKSQRRHIIKLIEEEADLKGLVVRPLCAQYLDPSIPESNGTLDRSKFLAIIGKSRKPQIKLADELNINNYPCASGGCRLTEKGYTEKLRDYIDNEEEYSMKDISLLKLGRHIRLSKNNKLIIGKDKAENKKLKMHCNGSRIYLEPDFAGPSILISGPDAGDFLSRAVNLLVEHTKKDKIGDKIYKWQNNDKSIIELQEVSR